MVIKYFFMAFGLNPQGFKNPEGLSDITIFLSF